MNDAYSKVFGYLPELNEIELEALAGVCQAKIEGKRKARREALRQELMSNLQSALSDILHNNFTLIIKNTELNPEEDECYAVCFDPQDIYSIEMIDSKQRQRYFF